MATVRPTPSVRWKMMLRGRSAFATASRRAVEYTRARSCAAEAVARAHGALRPEPRRSFSLFPSPAAPSANRIYDAVRCPEHLSTLLLLAEASNRPLVTLWTTTFCSTCTVIKPFLLRLIEVEGAGERQGGLAYAEVHMDSGLIGDLPALHGVRSVPTLLAFGAGQSRGESRVGDARSLKDENFLREWLVAEASKGG